MTFTFRSSVCVQWAVYLTFSRINNLSILSKVDKALARWQVQRLIDLIYKIYAYSQNLKMIWEQNSKNVCIKLNFFDLQYLFPLNFSLPAKAANP